MRLRTTYERSCVTPPQLYGLSRLQSCIQHIILTKRCGRKHRGIILLTGAQRRCLSPQISAARRLPRRGKLPKTRSTNIARLPQRSAQDRWHRARSQPLWPTRRTTRRLWERVIRQLRAKSMPPVGNAAPGRGHLQPVRGRISKPSSTAPPPPSRIPASCPICTA